MTFYTRKRRAPSVIIVSLIDILAILLIFFIVTTTFQRNQPQLQINLPESKTAEEAPAENLSRWFCASRAPTRSRSTRSPSPLTPWRVRSRLCASRLLTVPSRCRRIGKRPLAWLSRPWMPSEMRGSRTSRHYPAGGEQITPLLKVAQAVFCHLM